MKKTTIYIIIGLLIASIAFAQIIATSISQEEYDNTDFSTRYMNVTEEQINIKSDVILFNISYETLEKQGNNWFTTKTYFIDTYRIDDYIICRQDNNISVCTNNIITHVRSNVNNEILEERNKLEEQKTRITEEIDIRSLNLGDLNQ